MAKKSISTTFEHATIDLSGMKITEELKDGNKVYDMMEVLKDWDGIENISIVLKHGAMLSSALNDEVGD